MHIARIKNGVVVNIEIAYSEWVQENDGTNGCQFIPYSQEEPAHIGLAWDPFNGFEQSPTTDEPLPQ